MIKIGKLKADKCGIGVMGTNIDVDEAEITNTGIAAWDGTLQAHPGPHGADHESHREQRTAGIHVEPGATLGSMESVHIEGFDDAVRNEGDIGTIRECKLVGPAETDSPKPKGGGKLRSMGRWLGDVSSATIAAVLATMIGPN